MTGEPAISFGFALALMFAGILAQFVARMATLEEAGDVPPPWTYLRKHPYRSLNLVLGSTLLLYIFQELGQLNAVTAILTGYACQDAADRLRRNADAKLGP